MDQKKVLITGSEGLIGQTLVEVLREHGCLVFAATKEGGNNFLEGSIKLDLRSERDIEDVLFAEMPDYVVNLAAIGGVKNCEENPEEAYEVNVNGVKRLVSTVNRIKAVFIQLSSAYVFQTLLQGHYTLFDENCPHVLDLNNKTNGASVYAKTKRESEIVLGSILPEQKRIIVRSSLLFGDYQKKKGSERFDHAVLRALKRGESFHVNLEQGITPMYLDDFCRVLTYVIQSEAYYGVLHITGKDPVTRYEFACKLAEGFGYDPDLIIPPEPQVGSFQGRFPRDATLKSIHIENLLSSFGNVPPTLDGGIQRYKRDMLAREV